MKILVVDDHSLITEAMKALLTDLDPAVQVEVAHDADNAQRLAQQHTDADLMLLDLNLPGASGTSLLETL
nr:response regulator [Burkholderiaceae bacterium]